MILLARQRVEPFTERQIELVSTFADQAVIAIENTRLITEQREALEQQTSTAEVLQVINASPGNLAPVFDAMLQRATRLCGTTIGSFWSYNGEAFQVLASTIDDTGRTMQPGPDTALWRIAHSECVPQIADVETELAYRADTVGQMRTRLAGTRTALAVALRKDETLVGAIATGRPEVRPFTDKQIALLQNFAAQAVVAMENARLLTEQREALERQTATAEVLQVINASPGHLAPVFDAMLERALRLCGAAFGVFHTFDGERFQSVALRGVPAAFAAIRRDRALPTDPNSPPGLMLVTGSPVQVVDAITNQYFVSHPNLRDEQIDMGGARSALNIPLLKDGAVVGSFVIYRKEPGVWPEQIALLESFAAQAVIAMENATGAEKADAVVPAGTVGACNDHHHVGLIDGTQQGAADRRVVERRMEVVEAHDPNRSGRFLDLHGHAHVAREQRHMVGGQPLQPIDLALHQCRDRCGGIAERLPFHAVEMGYLGAGGVALLSLAAWHIGGEPLVGGSYPRVEFGRQEAVRPAADHLSHLGKWIGSGQPLRHDARHVGAGSRQRGGQVREGPDQAEAHGAVFGSGQLAGRGHQRLAETVSGGEAADARHCVTSATRQFQGFDSTAPWAPLTSAIHRLISGMTVCHDLSKGFSAPWPTKWVPR